MTRQALLFGVFTVCLLWIHVWMDPDTSERKKSPLNLFLVAVAKSLTSNKAAASIPFHLLNLFCCRCQDFYGCGRVCVASGWIHQRDAMKRHHILFMLPPAMDRKSKLLFKCPSHVFLWEERSSFTPPPTETSHLLTWWSERLYLHIHTSRSHQKENDVCRLPSFTTEMEIVFLVEWFSLLVSSRRWFCIMWHMYVLF